MTIAVDGTAGSSGEDRSDRTLPVGPAAVRTGRLDGRGGHRVPRRRRDPDAAAIGVTSRLPPSPR